MIGEKPNGWSFVYLCTDMRAVREATHMGIPADKALMFHKIRQGSDDAWVSINDQTSNFRSQSGQVFTFDRDNSKPRIIPQEKNSSAFHRTKTLCPVASRSSRTRKVQEVRWLDNYCNQPFRNAKLQASALTQSTRRGVEQIERCVPFRRFPATRGILVTGSKRSSQFFRRRC